MDLFGSLIRRHASVIAVALAAASSVASAQPARVVAPDQSPAGREITLFVPLDAGRPFHGALLSVPSSWTLLSAVALDSDGRETLLNPVTDPGLAGRFRLDPDWPMDEPAEVRLVVRPGAMPVAARWSFVPVDRVPGWGRDRFTLRESERVSRPLRVASATRNSGRMLRTGSGYPIAVLDAGGMPDLGTGSAWTIESWFRTTDLDAVLVSTWDGRETSSYPVEIVVDPTGRLAVYRGQLGSHRSLRAPQPVADGAWHHLAVIHDPEGGWTRLAVDGQPADSLYEVGRWTIPGPAHVALGGRAPDARTAVASFDEFRIWSTARPIPAIRTDMTRALGDQQDRGVVLGFEDGIPRGLLAGTSPRPRIEASDLRFRDAGHGLSARADDETVTLTWTDEDRPATAHVVERSRDGSRFEPVATVPGSAGLLDPATGLLTFRHSERAPPDGVAFYRIRKRDPSGADRTTPVIKVGLGQVRSDPVVTLEGAYPNPFNPNTTISYRVERPADVSVSIWDLSGQLVQVLRDARHEPGVYTVTFVAEALPSGPYFVRLETVTGVQSYQIVLAK